MLRSGVLAAVLVTSAACTTVPDRAYYPRPGHGETTTVAEALHRVAQAGSDDPSRYSFAFVESRDVSAYTAEDATFYFTEGLARQPLRVMEPLIAHQVSHELLGHAGQRRTLSISLTAGFTVLGVLLPGASLLDFLVSPLIVRAYTRDQVIAADRRAIELLRAMGYEAPRRSMADALSEAARVNGPPRGGWLATEPDLTDRLAALEPLETAYHVEGPDRPPTAPQRSEAPGTAGGLLGHPKRTPAAR
jgi:Zn-dependent protease with chaperone function